MILLPNSKPHEYFVEFSFQKVSEKKIHRWKTYYSFRLKTRNVVGNTFLTIVFMKYYETVEQVTRCVLNTFRCNPPKCFYVNRR